MTALVRENTAVGSRPETIFIQGRNTRVKREGLFGDCWLSFFVYFICLSCMGYVGSFVRRSIEHQVGWQEAAGRVNDSTKVIVWTEHHRQRIQY